MPGKMNSLKKWTGLNGTTIEINYDLCDGCGTCVAACNSGVMEELDDIVFVSMIDDCARCCSCVKACPAGAIHNSACIENKYG